MKRLFLVSAMVVAWYCIALLSVSPALAGCYPDNENPACEGNFDYDCDVDGSDASVFKSDFGRSGLKNPCPSSGPAPVPKTGQTTCYDESGDPVLCTLIIPGEGQPYIGQDGGQQKGVAWPNPRFTDNGDGTVTDNLTGLIWLKNANCFGIRTWDNALSDCNGLNTGECGLTDGSSALDWRLPNRRELFSLIDDNYYYPALPPVNSFTNVHSDYWSSTSKAGSITNAWTVNMYTGVVNHYDRTNLYYVWPVRGGQ